MRYRSVGTMLAWPVNFWTGRVGTPEITSWLATVCRRVWKVTLVPSRSAPLDARANAPRKSCIGEPLSFVKTRSSRAAFRPATRSPRNDATGSELPSRGAIGNVIICCYRSPPHGEPFWRGCDAVVIAPARLFRSLRYLARGSARAAQQCRPTAPYSMAQ